jgi:hypothetical protein
VNAFKKYGVSILKELSVVERMHTYVLETLITIMTARVERHQGN